MTSRMQLGSGLLAPAESLTPGGAGPTSRLCPLGDTQDP